MRDIKTLLKKVKSGRISINEALSALTKKTCHDLGYAKLDLHRAVRKGFPEVVFGEGKSLKHITEISRKLIAEHKTLIITRAGKDIYRKIRFLDKNLQYDEDARIIYLEQNKGLKKGTILIITAGTLDLKVAKEAYITAKVMGNSVEIIQDVGVCGVHRLLKHMDQLEKANVIIVVAGMEGALPSVVGGLVSRPVIAVPTSIGYGASFGGIGALLTMLNSCAPGVSVMNIDNGFGAGYFASLINK